jgi:Domain of unknown function (DUF5666)
MEPIMTLLLKQAGSRTAIQYLVLLILAGLACIFVITPGTAKASGPEDSNYKYIPATIESRIYGTIRKIPASRNGLWSINNRDILVNSETRIYEEYGNAAVGAYAEVEGINTDKTFVASKIIIKRAKK